MTVVFVRKGSFLNRHLLPLDRGLPQPLLALPGELRVRHGLEVEVGARAGVALAAVPVPGEDGRLRSVALGAVRLRGRRRLARRRRR
jgi:hypothetical protein